MAKISDYSKVTELTNDNVFIIDGQNGTKGILANELAKGLNDFLSATDVTDGKDFNELGLNNYLDQTSIPIIQPDTGDGNTLYRTSINDLVFKIIDKYADMPTRRNTWRGKNLGSSVTDEQYNQIKAGTFKDLFLGDYWLINNINWRIVDFDYWYTTGSFDKLDIHHLVIMPDTSLNDERMNATDTTVRGYAGSTLRVKINSNRIDDFYVYTVKTAFGNSHVLDHRECLTNAVTNGYPSGICYTDSYLELPNEIMMYGCHIFSPHGDGTITMRNITKESVQLAGMRINPELINIRGTYWLRDVVNEINFAMVYFRGTADWSVATGAAGVRPVFGLVG